MVPSMLSAEVLFLDIGSALRSSLNSSESATFRPPGSVRLRRLSSRVGREDFVQFGEDVLRTEILVAIVAARNQMTVLINHEQGRNSIAAQLYYAGNIRQLIVIDRQPRHFRFVNVGFPAEMVAV